MSRSPENYHLKVASERLGHATVSITLDTYSHAIPALQEEEVAKRIAGLVLGQEQRPPDHRAGVKKTRQGSTGNTEPTLAHSTLRAVGVRAPPSKGA